MLLVGVDVAARLTAESQLASRLQREVPEAGSADVSLQSFPFLGRLLVSGNVARVKARATDLQIERLSLSTVSVDLRNVRVDRDALVSDRQLDLKGIGRGTARAELTQSSLSDALGVPVVLTPGRVSVRVRGRTFSASVAVRNGTLTLSGVSVPLPRVSIPGLPLLDCPPSAEVLEGLLRLSCTVDRVPEELLRRVTKGRSQ